MNAKSNPEIAPKPRMRYFRNNIITPKKKKPAKKNRTREQTKKKKEKKEKMFDPTATPFDPNKKNRRKTGAY